MKVQKEDVVFLLKKYMMYAVVLSDSAADLSEVTQPFEPDMRRKSSESRKMQFLATVFFPTIWLLAVYQK